MFCDNEAEVGNMCASCMNGFNSKSSIRKFETSNTKCSICGNLSTEKICSGCMMEFFPKLKSFLDDNPGMTYLEINFHKDLPISRKVLYEFVQAGIIKIKGG